MGVPPVAVLYHLYWPLLPPEAVSVKVLPGQLLTPVPVGGAVFVIVAITGVRVLSHPVIEIVA